jgi:hypothetical protein
MKRPSKAYRKWAARAKDKRGQALLAKHYEAVKDKGKGSLVATDDGMVFKKDCPMPSEEKTKWLREHGFIVGIRDSRLNTNYPGNFMVVEEYEDSELPTVDGRDGPWCIVGDDLAALVDQAYDVHAD